MTNLIRYTKPQVEIGEYIQVLVGASGYKTSPLGSNYIPPGTYNQSDYPELFDVIGYQTGAMYTPRTSGTTSIIRALVYNNGLYVYGGDGGVLRTSTDAITWTSRTSGTTNGIYNLIYANGLYVYVSPGTYASSTNAITWTGTAVGRPENPTGLAYGNGIYLVVTVQNRILRSTDGINWTLESVFVPGGAIFTLTYGNGLFVAGGNSDTPLTSTDGITWVQPTATFGPVTALCYGNGIYVACGVYSFWTSTDGLTWIQRTPSFSFYGNRLIYDNGLYVAVGVSGVISTSTNAITWTSRTSGTTSTINAITYGNGLFVYAGDGGVLATSTTSTRVEYTTYDYNTQFDVPSLVAQESANVTSLSPFTTPQNVSYIRAR